LSFGTFLILSFLDILEDLLRASISVASTRIKVHLKHKILTDSFPDNAAYHSLRKFSFTFYIQIKIASISILVFFTMSKFILLMH